MYHLASSWFCFRLLAEGEKAQGHIMWTDIVTSSQKRHNKKFPFDINFIFLSATAFFLTQSHRRNGSIDVKRKKKNLIFVFLDQQELFPSFLCLSLFILFLLSSATQWMSPLHSCVYRCTHKTHRNNEITTVGRLDTFLCWLDMWAKSVIKHYFLLFVIISICYIGWRKKLLKQFSTF